MKISEKIIKLANSLGIKRKDMPQVRNEDIKEFKEYLNEKNIKLDKVKLKVTDLSPTQEELDTKKADNIFNEGNCNKFPIFISEDNKVLDGHHRWLGLMRNDEKAEMNCNRIHLKAQEALKVMSEFSKSEKEDIKGKKIAERILEYASARHQSDNRTTVDGECPHHHSYSVDNAGNGQTTFTSGKDCENHIHKITNYKVSPAHGHTHEIEIDERDLIDIKPEFKTFQGFDHWLNRLRHNQKDKVKDKEIKVAGTKFANPEQVYKAHKKGKLS